VLLADGRLQVLRIGPEREWQPVPGRARSLPPELRVASVAIDGEVVGAREPIIFLPDGLGVPFRIGLAWREESRAIAGDAAGSIRVETR
jgi:predicted dienelactone hydrolase